LSSWLSFGRLSSPTKGSWRSYDGFFAVGLQFFAHKLRQLGGIHRNPPRLIFGKQLGRRFAGPRS
jgi:hypothetical protein